MTGWGRREILEELPFSVGLQMIHCDDAAHNIPREWQRNRKTGDVDALALIEDALCRNSNSTRRQ